ncbi:MAG: 3-oxoacyl-ACP reductase FabG [Desulfarculus sp.]|nr:MAG: 3-oxoacyl-ACP reductase FabG [Desulfarculus sp.]
MKLKDKVAIVTGAARGIGAAAARTLAAEGAAVAINDLDEAALRPLAAEIEKMGGRCLVVAGNVADRDFAARMVADTVEKLGGLDVLVNNAGITRDAMGHKMTPDQWDQVIAVNLTGVFNCLQAAMIPMRRQGSGAIINLSSTSRYGNPGQLNYAASKGGVVGLTRTAAKELGPKGVRVNCVSPGTIDTEMLKTVPQDMLKLFTQFMVPLRRLGRPEEVARLIVFLASDEASYITGQTINVDGGAHMA